MVSSSSSSSSSSSRVGLRPGEGDKTGPSKATKRQRQETLSPTSYLRMLYGNYNKSGDLSTNGFQKPREEDIAAYDLEAVRAIRAKDIDKLRELHTNGKSLNACNQFGESLLHMACRRGDTSIVKFMIEDAKARVDIRDDFGRNPFHDACWTSTPNYGVMDVLIDAAEPWMLLSEDVRGNTPFDYARREHYAKWVIYLENKKELLQKKTRLATSPNQGKPASS